ncbi:hypothetical protein DFH09DRAFT_974295 [Mycena vulgaris]|nr:hypothetical protein DFH09DRAFT_974295 [Mycena vulgaris]
MADIGLQVTKDNVIAVYLEVREKAFTKVNILSALRKTGIRPLNPNVFTEEDYAPSWATSNQTHLPDTYPRSALPDVAPEAPIPSLHIPQRVVPEEQRRT